MVDGFATIYPHNLGLLMMRGLLNHRPVRSGQTMCH
jgi:hypothetical protein